MTEQKEYFELDIESLRILGKWAADCAESVLPIFEEFNKGDARPREAINGIRIFFRGRKKTGNIA